jgi:hypothetical protein
VAVKVVVVVAAEASRERESESSQRPLTTCMSEEGWRRFVTVIMLFIWTEKHFTEENENKLENFFVVRKMVIK